MISAHWLIKFTSSSTHKQLKLISSLTVQLTQLALMVRCLSLLKCSMYRSELLEHLKVYIIFRYNLSRNHHLGQSQITTTLHPINSHVVGMLQHFLCFWPCNVCILKVNKFYSIDPRSSLTPTCTKRMNRREKCPRRHQS